MGLLLSVVLVASGLAVVNAVQPPRIIAVESYPGALVAGGGARVLLKFNQPLSPVAAADVWADPEVPVTVAAEGSDLTITLGDALGYGESLRLGATVTSAATGRSGAVATEVRAPDTRVATLVRHPDGDRIVATDLVSGGPPVDLVVRPRIQEFALAPGRVFAITADERGRAELTSTASGSGETVSVITRSDATLTQLRSDESSLQLGVVASGLRLAGQLTDRSLLLFDASRERGAPVVLADSAGDPLRVADWRFVPGTTAVVVRDAEGAVWRADPALGQAAVALGGAGEAVSLPGPEMPVEVSAGGTHLNWVAGPSAGSRYTPPGTASRIGEVCSSPNGRVIAAEVVSSEGISDEREVRPGFTHTNTVFLDAHTAEPMRSMIGFAPHWCSS